ncbi:MAG: hydrogenase expression/formation protein [Elusimicrobia bacterium]|nr:hydrogenase expression/formation protein [Elusimicrobiota bacterium]
MILPVGKLPSDILGRLLKKHKILDPSVVLGPGIGEDAAVLSFGNKLLVAKTDPITFTSEDIGWYTVAVNANDVVTRGARPRWFLCTALLPEGKTTPRLAEDIFRQIHRACRALRISSVGGHSEITSGLARPILVGFMLGEVLGKRPVTTSGVREGDCLILTKSIALEAASVIVRERGSEVTRKWGAAFVRRCRNFIKELSVVPEALIATRMGGVHSMHDPTEGGLSTGIYEMAEASQVGFVIERENILIQREAQVLCGMYRLDPLGILSSGALLIACDPKMAFRIVRRIRKSGVSASVIGRAVPRRQGVLLREGGSAIPFPRFPRDEIACLAYRLQQQR